MSGRQEFAKDSVHVSFSCRCAKRKCVMARYKRTYGGAFASILALTLWISSSLGALDKEYSLLVKGAN